MRMAIGSDSTSGLTIAICTHLEEKGIELVRCGQCAGVEAEYIDAAQAVAERVASGECEQGLLFCNTAPGSRLSPTRCRA